MNLIKDADALVIAIDLYSLPGAEFARRLAQMQTVVARCLPTARLLRCRYLVVSNQIAANQMACTPCYDRDALRQATEHAYLLMSRDLVKVGVLVMPDTLAPDVFAQIAITQAKSPRQTGSPRRHDL